MADWIFQANPKRYDVLAAAGEGSDSRWSMKVHRDKVAVGDRVWFLIAGREAGIYVVGTVASPVYETEDDGFGRWKVDIKYEAFIEPPLLRAELLSQSELADFQPLRGVMGTNFAVPPKIAGRLAELAEPRLRPTSGSPSTVTEAVPLDQALQRHHDTTRRQLQEAILGLTADEFEQLVAKILEALGFEQIEVVGRAGDGGIDVRALLSLQGVTSVRTVVQAKRWTNTVGPRVVRELRGSLQVEERGLIVTTADFTAQARSEAAASGRAPIGLIPGSQLAQLCLDHAIGVEVHSVPIYKVNLAGLR